jgi:hypothetical protein
MPLKPGRLEPIFASIDEHGGIDGFMREMLLLEPADMDAIREDLLEAAND